MILTESPYCSRYLAQVGTFRINGVAAVSQVLCTSAASE